MLKTVKNVLSQTCQTNQINLSKYLHSKFDLSCTNVVKMFSLATTKIEYENNVKFGDLRFKGEICELEYYDSHLYDSKIVYKQSSIPTVLILPSSEDDFIKYDSLIGDLVQNEFRVLALKFPGFGESRILDKRSIYDFSPFKKISIMYDFVNHLLNFRKK
jgi:hypothetical protein